MKKDNKYPNEYADTLITLKENIRNLRKKKYKSAEKFAEALGVSLKTVQGWENLDNNRWPDLIMMLKVCDELECDLDYLLDRMKEPTHKAKYIHEETGLSVDAVTKLIGSKDNVIDSPLSDIIIHKNAARLLRVLSLAADEDEICWLNLDKLPRGLLSSYAEKPIDFSPGVGSDVADFLASQELISIIKEIRNKQEKDRQAGTWKDRLKPHYDVYSAKFARDMMLEKLDESMADISNSIMWFEEPSDEFPDEKLNKEEIRKKEKWLEVIQKLMNKIRNASFAEFKRGEIEKEYNEIYGEGEDNGEH